MDDKATNTYPIPYCWRESYSSFERQAKLNRFPTLQYLSTRTLKAKQFCWWLKKQLDMPAFKQCKGLKDSPCRICEKSGMDNFTALSTLAKIVAAADPELSALLRETADSIPIYQESRVPQKSKHSKPVPSPDGSKGPIPPLAKAMKIPVPREVVDAIAHQSKKTE